jgi:branched-chain amino acid transport system permease protein
MKKHYIILALLSLLGLVYPMVFPGYLTVAIMVLLFVGWATSWDFLGGWCGQVSLGHASFVGLGAYFVAVGSATYGIAPWWSMLGGLAFAAVLALLWGKLTFSLKGPYFSLSTIAIAEILRLVAINEEWLSGGATGVFIMDLPTPFGIDLFDKLSQYYMALLFAVLTLLVVFMVSTRKLGYQLRAVREDEDAAMAAGINPTTVKLKAFAVSGALTSIGGGIYAIFLSFLEPHVIFNLLLSIQIALTAIIGGRGTLWGPALGAVVLVVAGEVFRTTFAQANLLVYGLLILVVVLFFPRGIVGEIVRNMIRRSYANRAQSQ